MVSFHKTCIFNIIFALYLNKNVIYSINENKYETISQNVKKIENEKLSPNLNDNGNYNDNIDQLKSMIGNDELYKNLRILEKLILESLEKDKLKYPVLKEGTEQLLDISKFKKNYITDTSDKTYVIPTLQSTFHDIVKYEYFMKGQLIEVYNSNISDIIKKKIFIVRTLKTIKLMLIPLNYYKQNNDFKAALEEVNRVFISKDVQERKASPIVDHETFFNNLLNHVREIKKNKEIENKGETLILGDKKINIMDSNDFFFTTNSNVNFMEALDDITNQYGLGFINHLGPHLIALGHFTVLKLALKNYKNYFESKNTKFFSWQKILEFSLSDRFKVLDMMCDHDSVYYSNKKRRKIYLKVERSETSMECNILEYLIHYFNKYQLEIIKTTQDTDFDLHDIAKSNVAEAMYLNIKDEDKFHRTVVTNYWFPSPIKKYYTLYVRKHIPNNLVDELLNLMSSGTVEKMRKSLTFLVHVNSFLQLDFFHQLNEPPLGLPRAYPLSLILEHKFKQWMSGSPAGFFFSNFINPYKRKDLHNKVMAQKFEPPKMNEWNKVLKTIIECAYEMYFDQRHVKNLYKYHNIYNINNKLMLMRDSIDLYKKHFNDVLFFADIFNMKKYLTATPLVKKGIDRGFYYIHTIMGNSVNFYKYGIIYGFKINKEILKEVVDELFSIYNFNTDIFSDTSFLQTVYLLFRIIEETYRTQRRNDRMSVNNVFFMNVANNYSKLNKEVREVEIHNSMASRFYSKTMFSAFQMLFSTMLSNHTDHLDKIYGLSENIKVATSMSAYLTFSYVYNGSIMDSLTNSLFPPYAKKPITQLKYGKTFIFSNYFMLASKMYDMLNYKNLSLLCEYQAVASANFYSSKKVVQFMTRKYFPIITYYLYKRIFQTGGFIKSKESYKIFVNWGKLPPVYFYFNLFTNLYLDSGKYFPGGFSNSLREQSQHVSNKGYPRKPLVYGFTQNVFIQFTNIITYAFCFFGISQLYAYFENVHFYITNNVRFLERYYSVFNKYFINRFKKKLKEYTSDVLIKYQYETYINIRKYGYLNEAIEARIDAKNKIKEYLYDKDQNVMNNLRTYVMENMHKYNISTYVDDDIFFDDCGTNEEFLNDRCNICPVYEESNDDDQKSLSSDSKDTPSVKSKAIPYIDYKRMPEDAIEELSEEENCNDDMNLTNDSLVTSLPKNE
ncbi:hypothetical protein PFFVO_06038 [Plasmodium falciparum Vietnam Oak-Knoll (FVO)]|uniref:Uncharacterized protein n=1 Tax=Plasmodium falciparum Vietnam Oak-Knoll (FVO) TaxID=1036723 RepID=A0A024UWQ0_PLAFA|nr:hypothetical protein PFFVO_06038 [Plasmodium falciparum Vietnam Oak-Knoll (FVO)]